MQKKEENLFNSNFYYFPYRALWPPVVYCFDPENYVFQLPENCPQTSTEFPRLIPEPINREEEIKESPPPEQRTRRKRVSTLDDHTITPLPVNNSFDKDLVYFRPIKTDIFIADMIAKKKFWLAKPETIEPSSLTPLVVGRILYLCGWCYEIPSPQFCSLYLDQMVDHLSPVLLASIPAPRLQYGFKALFQHIYMVGGYTGEVPCRSCYRYSIERNKWFQIPDLNLGLPYVQICTFNNRYIFCFEYSWERDEIWEELDATNEEAGWITKKISLPGRFEAIKMLFIQQVSNTEIFYFGNTISPNFVNFSNLEITKRVKRLPNKCNRLCGHRYLAPGYFSMFSTTQKVVTFSIVKQTWLIDTHFIGSTKNQKL